MVPIGRKMLSQEMFTWDVPEICEHMYLLLPQGWKYNFEKSDVGAWEVSIHNASGEVVWSDSYGDPRIVLFNAYGWLNSQQTPNPKRHPMWVPRSERKKIKLSSLLGLPGVDIGDPEDLDPSEIEDLYQND
jgi:hypothetical protein